MITGRTRLAGIVGWPVSHSRSPLLHNHWLARHRIDGAYVPLPVRPEDFARAIAGLRAACFAGANVTVPHKEAACALCTTLDAAARTAGAVNTLVFTEAGIDGSNTDGAGFLASLAAHGIPHPGPTLLLGAGGAARSIAAALLATGAQVTVANRTRDRADALKTALPALSILDWHGRTAALANHALLVNTTTQGMTGQPPLSIDLSAAPSTLIVADIVYSPLETPLMIEAKSRGLRTVPGLDMLLHQAAPGFSRWFGVMPSIDGETYRLLAADIQAGKARGRQAVLF